MAASLQGSAGRLRRRARAWGRPGEVMDWARENGRSLLFVDDNRFLLEMTARVFQRIGTPCRIASTHDHAVEAMAQDDDVRTVILDFEMPDGDVVDLVRRLREIRPDVVLVGSSGTDHRLDFAERGVDRYVPKPWRLGDLAEAAQR